MAQNSNKAITEIRYEMGAYYNALKDLTESTDVYNTRFLFESARRKFAYIAGYITALNNVEMISDKEYYDFMDVVRTMFKETIATFKD